MKAIGSEFYGDDVRWFIGEVKSINDPAGLGRVRVRIFGIHDANTADIKPTDLPWASVVLPVTQAGTSGKTQPTGIQIGAQVFGIFMDGKHSQVPLVIGSIPHNSTERVKFDTKDPNIILTDSTSELLGHLSGDIINEDMQNSLSELGVETSVGDSLTTEQAAALNAAESGSGDLDTLLIGNSRHEQVFNFFKQLFQEFDHSNPSVVAAGFVGNFMHEAGPQLNPSENEDTPLVPGSRGGYGLAQWTGSRRKDLEVWANVHGGGAGNLLVQLEFAKYELMGSHKYVKNYLMRNTTLYQATETIFAWYENPQVSVNMKQQNPEAVNWRAWQANGGIQGFAEKTSGQTAVTSAYLNEFTERFGDAQNILTNFGGI